MGNRNLCPVCDSEPKTSFTMTYAVPDGWPLPKEVQVCLCPACGMIWYDSKATQFDYDRYYLKYYGGQLDNPCEHHRLMDVATAVYKFAQPDWKIVDFGAGTPYLAQKLVELGFKHVQGVNIGDPMPQGADLVIMTHVIEHIYAIRSAMKTITDALTPTGCILVETPESVNMAQRTSPPILDYHAKHVNHFSALALDLLMAKYDMAKIFSGFTEQREVNTPVYRAIYQKGGFERTYGGVEYRLTMNTAELVDRLNDIKLPVIVWGLGETAWHLLSCAKLNVAYYVDNDPAYKGATIGGVPVKDKVDSGEPILIMGSICREAIEEKIRKLGLKNEVLTLE